MDIQISYTMKTVENMKCVWTFADSTKLVKWFLGPEGQFRAEFSPALSTWTVERIAHQ